MVSSRGGASQRGYGDAALPSVAFPRMSAGSPKPLTPPRRDAGARGRRPSVTAPAERLDPGTILAPTRFLRGLVAQGGPPASAALCDGRRSLADVARAAGLEPGLALELLSRLYAEGLVCETGDAPVPPLLFLEHARSLCLRWRRARLEPGRGLEAAFAGGAYSRRFAIGYMVEVMHIVRGAAGHIAAAIAHAADERLQLRLSEYLEDEYWHGELMENALRAAGLSDAELARAQPLPATLAVSSSWRHAAHTDLLLYGGLIAITESGPDETSDVEAQFQKTTAQGVLPEAAWRPYFEHAFGDGAADHLSHGKAIFAAAGPLPRARRDALRRLMLSHTEALMLQEQAIIDFYWAAEGPAVHDVSWLE